MNTNIVYIHVDREASLRGVVVKVLDSDIIPREFDLSLPSYVYFRSNHVFNICV